MSELDFDTKELLEEIKESLKKMEVYITLVK